MNNLGEAVLHTVERFPEYAAFTAFSHSLVFFQANDSDAEKCKGPWLRTLPPTKQSLATNLKIFHNSLQLTENVS